MLFTYVQVMQLCCLLLIQVIHLFCLIFCLIRQIFTIRETESGSTQVRVCLVKASDSKGRCKERISDVCIIAY